MAEHDYYQTLGVERSAAHAVREELLEAPGDRLGHELVNVSPERGDLLHAARGDERVERARHHVHGLDLGGEMAVQLVHLELPLEVRDHAQALDDHLRVPPVREVDDELGEDVDLDVVEPGERLTQERDALVEREHRRLVLGIADDPDDDAVEDLGRALDHVDVPVRDGVLVAGVDRGDHSASKSVSRVEP